MRHNTPRSPSADEIAECFYKNFKKYHYEFVQCFTEHLSDLSRIFHGDLSEILVLAVIGQSYINSLRHVGSSIDSDLQQGWINASRLAHVTGISRQTVRRKLVSLEAKGWIIQNENACWTIKMTDGESVAGRHFIDLNDRSVRRTAILFARLLPIISFQGSAE